MKRIMLQLMRTLVTVVVMGTMAAMIFSLRSELAETKAQLAAAQAQLAAVRAGDSHGH